MSNLLPANSGERDPGLLTVKAGELLRLQGGGLTTESSPLYIASDLQVSQYGIRGLVLVDSAPENRTSSYYSNGHYNSGEPVSGSDNPGSDDIGGTNEYTIRHYGTRHGFKALRLFVLPESVDEFMRTDKWIGEAMLSKCMEQDTTPKDFYEQPVSLSDALMTDHGKSLGEEIAIEKKKVAVLAGILLLADPTTSLSNFQDRDGGWEYPYHGSNNQRAYISFHPWMLYKPVLDTLALSTTKALQNFDEMLGMFDRTGVERTKAVKAWDSDANRLNGISIALPQIEPPQY